MTQPIPSEHFIPIPRAAIIDALVEEGVQEAGVAGAHPPAATSRAEADGQFRDFARVLSSLFHYEFHERLEQLKQLYAPINPDQDAQTLHANSTNPQTPTQRSMDVLVSTLEELIERANYRPITDQDLQESLAEESLFRVRLQVNFDDFERALFFGRGATRRTETVRTWFGLRKSDVEFTNLDRVIVFVEVKDEAYFREKDLKNLAFEPGTVVLKLFQNVPKGDLEMLFPNTEIRMRTLDKLLIGIPAAVSGIVMITTKLGATLLLTGGLAAFVLGFRNEPVTLDQTALLALATGLSALGAYLWKQYSTFKNRKIRFMKTLTESLYFKNLDNNAGVFHTLLDAAEEEECKEVLLAFHTLATQGPMTASQIDAHVEAWFQRRFELTVDFEVADACNKLVRLGLVETLASDPDNAADEPRYRALSTLSACVRLDYLWDNIFRFGTSAPEHSPSEQAPSEQAAGGEGPGATEQAAATATTCSTIPAD